jgi:isohexenylglutaconyl-CoA hydratase
MAGRTYANIELERDGAVARLVLNRPERRNALTHAMMLELEDAFGRVRDDPNCRVLVLRGAGGHFCAAATSTPWPTCRQSLPMGAADALVPAYRQFGDAAAGAE